MTDSYRWVAPPADRLHTLREDMLLHLRHPLTFTATEDAMRNNRGTIRPAGMGSAEAATLMLADEYERLRTAKLFSVSEGMSVIGGQAGERLPTWDVRREDLPMGARSGLMVFDRPIGLGRADLMNEDHEIVAVSWGPTQMFADAEDMVWLTFWAMTPDGKESEAILRRHGLRSSEIAAIQAANAPVSWHNEAALVFGKSFEGFDEDRPVRLRRPGEGHIMGMENYPWVQTVRAIWLMYQRKGKRPIAEVREGPRPSRTQGRRWTREGIDVDAVQVIDVHSRPQARRREATEGEGTGHAIGVQYYVGDFIRWQPYPSEGTIVPIVIKGHKRGPDGAPWSTRPRKKVYRLDRPPGGRPPSPDGD